MRLDRHFQAKPDHRLFSKTQLYRDDPAEHGIDEHQEADEALMKHMHHVLVQHYPGHPWGVAVEHSQGVAVIFVMGFQQWGYRLKLALLKSDPGMREVIRGAGEMLERYRMPRSGFDLGQWRAAMGRWKMHQYRNRKPPE
jgi:hypothetical protein